MNNRLAERKIDFQVCHHNPHWQHADGHGCWNHASGDSKTWLTVPTKWNKSWSCSYWYLQGNELVRRTLRAPSNSFPTWTAGTHRATDEQALFPRSFKVCYKPEFRPVSQSRPRNEAWPRSRSSQRRQKRIGSLSPLRAC